MRASPIRLFALTALAVTALSSTAHATQSIQSFNEGFGSGDVKAGIAGTAGLTYCNAAELATAGNHGQCVFWMPFGLGGRQCVAWLPLDPPCVVNATQAYAQAAAELTGSVTLFGTTKSISVDASATTADGESSMEFVVTAFGNTLLDVTRTNFPVGVAAQFEEHKSYGLLGVSVGVTGVAAGFIGANIGGGAVTNGIQVNVTPTLDAIVVASADVSALCASAGIDGSVDVLNLQVPTSLDVTYANGQLGYGVSSTVDYSVLSGDLEVTASVCGVSESHTIASYPGWSGAHPVYSGAGTLSL